MKFRLPHLKLGEVIEASVLELLPSGELLLDVEGDLVRVENETRKPFVPGVRLELRVTAINPPQFQLIDRVLQRRRGAYDFSI